LFDEIRLSKKIPMLVVGAAAAVSVGIGLGSYVSSVQSLDALTKQRLSAAADVGVGEIRSYLEAIEEQLVLIADHPGTVTAVQDFAAAWQTMTEDGPT
jgi:methyl-accepting chemotaxis protein